MRVYVSLQGSHGESGQGRRPSVGVLLPSVAEQVQRLVPTAKKHDTLTNAVEGSGVIVARSWPHVLTGGPICSIPRPSLSLEGVAVSSSEQRTPPPGKDKPRARASRWTEV